MWKHNGKTPWAEGCSHGVCLNNLGSQMPIKGARMWPCCVPKCKLLIFYAIIYDCRHSKHINDCLRCVRDNGATCLKLQNRFLFWRPETLIMCAHTHVRSYTSPPTHVWNASSAGQSPSSSACYSFTPSELARGPSFYFPATSLLLALCQSFHCALTMIKDSFVTPSEASRRQKTSNWRCRATHKAKW